MISNYLPLSSRSGFNQSLKHFKIVSYLIEQLEQFKNLADVIAELEAENKIFKEQILSVVNVLLVERYQYSYKSYNFLFDLENAALIQQKVANWNLFDIVLVYLHPQTGVSLINPKNMTQWDDAGDFSKNEMVNIFCRSLSDDKHNLENDVINDIIKLFQGKYDAIKDDLYIDDTKTDDVIQTAETTSSKSVDVEEQSNQEQEHAEKPIENTSQEFKKVKMTAKYMCQVTNELFHNGNVEAWKNIIESYQKKYDSLVVYVYHDGARVKNLNSLFKWGKVKHGDAILFAIAGNEFKAISKLQKYLSEGASPRFEKYLKKDVNKPLSLF